MSNFTILDDFNFSGTNKPQTNLNNFNPKKQIQDDISKMFDDFIMVKTNQFNTFGVYKAKVECMLCVGGTRYIVAIVDNDSNMVGVKVPLSELNWKVFQTRYTDNQNELKNINIPAKEYAERRETSLNDKIKKWIEVNKTENLQAKTVYKPENLPLSVEILHMRESDSFAPTGTVLSALKLFQTVIILED